MTTHQLRDTTIARAPGRRGRAPADRGGAPTPAGRSILRRLWKGVLAAAHGIDAGALVAHGRPVPPAHPARRRRLDHDEVANRLDELYPRT